MSDLSIPARLRDISECVWWDWGYEDEHTHGADRQFLHTAADRIDELEAENKRLFDDAEQAWAALRTFERQVLAVSNGLRGIERTLNRRPAHGRALNVEVKP